MQAFKEIESKVGVEEGQSLWANFAKFAVYDDLKDLYHRCVPAIASFEDKIHGHRDELARMQEIIRNFDGLICDKPSKEQLNLLREYCNDTFILKQENETFKENSLVSFEGFEVKIVKLEELVKSTNKAMQKELFSAVRKAIGQLQSKEDNSGGLDPVEITETMRKMLHTKANVEVVQRIEESKASKVDCEMLLRWVDLLHKMLKSLAQVYAMKLQSDLDQSGLESPNEQKNRSVQLLHQTLLLTKWIESFNT